MPYFTNRGITPLPSAAYAGPGDLATFTFWGGLRGYTASFTGPAIDIVKASDGTDPHTINILSGGNLDIATIVGFGSTYVAVKLYDQSGGGNHFINPSYSTSPVVTINPSGLATSRAVLTFDGTKFLTNSGFTLSDPLTVSFIGNATARTGFSQRFFSVASGVSYDVGFDNGGASDNHWFLFATGVIDATATDTTYHAGQGIFDGASSSFYIDGSSTTGTTDTSLSTSGVCNIGSLTGGASRFLIGNIGEIGLASGNFSAVKANMNTQQHSFWGF